MNSGQYRPQPGSETAFPGAREDDRVSSRVLIIEDEETLAGVLVDNLVAEGYEVEVAADGHSGLNRWQLDPTALVVLDVMLPGIDGFELCRQMRRSGDLTPVLFLSARDQAEDRVTGLRAGGDDYLVKPFNLTEFLLRVSNMLKRRNWPAGAAAPAVLEFGGHSIDFRSWVATLKDGSQELLGEREIGILRLLAERSDQVVNRDEILDGVWGNDVFPSSRTIDNFIVRFRRLFEPDAAEPRYFHTVWGVGYRFTPEAADSGPLREEGKE
jgi:two-component system alkaline phosphatase synthesis response regulator PhoP